MALGVLNFRTLRPGRLKFGPVDATALTMAGVLPALTGAALFQAAATGSLTLAGVLPALVGRSYFAPPILPPRGPALRVRPQWQVATPQLGEPLHSPWRIAAALPLSAASGWRSAAPLPHPLWSQASNPVQCARRGLSTWRDAAWLRHRIGSISANPLPLPVALHSQWHDATPVATAACWETRFPIMTPMGLDSPWRVGGRLTQRGESGWRRALPTPGHWWSGWDSAGPPWPGVRYRAPLTPQPVRPRGQLDFRCFTPGALNFGPTCFGASGWLVPLRRTYSVLNSGSLKRLSDGADIPVSELSVSIDRDSWCWTLTAALLGPLAGERSGERTEIEAHINGFVWRFVVDSQTRSREFGQITGRISARSLPAWLAAPYAPTRSYRELAAKTAEQLALQELPNGWFLDWALPTWTVPGEVWQYLTLTPIEALARLAKSAGGRMQADPVLQKLWLAPRWPVLPWRWATTPPFATLVADYCLREEREGVPGAECDAIMVYGGVDGGIVALATRAGMPGLAVADPVNDALITDIPPATARAAQELADRWPLKRYQVTLPLQAPPGGAGLLLPGLFFDLSEGADGWRGLVTGVSITAKSGATTQTVSAVSA